MKSSSRFPLLLMFLGLCTLLALPAWAADPAASPAVSVARAGNCGGAAPTAPVCRDTVTAAPGLVPAGPQDVPFTNYSPDEPLPTGPLFVSFIGDCCTGGASLCACVNGYLRHCGSPQCDTGPYFSCLDLPCSTCHCY